MLTFTANLRWNVNACAQIKSHAHNKELTPDNCATARVRRQNGNE